MNLLEGKELKNYCLNKDVIAVDEARATKTVLDLKLDLVKTSDMINNLQASFVFNNEVFLEKGNKQAALRARKCTKTLSTLGKHYRALTIKQ